MDQKKSKEAVSRVDVMARSAALASRSTVASEAASKRTSNLTTTNNSAFTRRRVSATSSTATTGRSSSVAPTLTRRTSSSSSSSIKTTRPSLLTQRSVNASAQKSTTLTSVNKPKFSSAQKTSINSKNSQGKLATKAGTTPISTLTINTRIRNQKNIDEIEKCIKADRVIAEAQVIAFQLMKHKMNKMVQKQQTDTENVLGAIAEKLSSLRKQVFTKQMEIDRKRGLANVIQTTQQHLDTLKTLEMIPLLEGLQDIYEETETKKNTLPLENLTSAEEINDVLENINSNGSTPEQQEMLKKMRDAQLELDCQFNLINNVLTKAKIQTKNLLNTIDLKSGLETQTKPLDIQLM